ncbi:hypothetical protein SEA_VALENTINIPUFF_17 [Microbacterium phage ValentiniPuff]|uniref:Uncharacterized protein n=1 Tax=Microbacterium phage ValentiniPuff TaxID=2315705 RepID=A0A386KQ15_9CAUD|nr:hypothetical protein SEA_VALENTINIPUFF_17 [Microbacterium phage ValentiniPuff]
MSEEYDAGDPVETITLADPTPTPPDTNVSATRYLGLLYEQNVPLNPDRPYVLATLAEADQLLSAAWWGWQIPVREMHAAGMVVEREHIFDVAEEPELMLWTLTGDRPDFDVDLPQLRISVGPKGGVRRQRL